MMIQNLPENIFGTGRFQVQNNDDNVGDFLSIMTMKPLTGCIAICNEFIIIIMKIYISNQFDWSIM